MRREEMAAIAVAAVLAVLVSLGLGFAVQPQKSIHDGVFTAAQIEAGAKVWEDVCSECHPKDIFGPDYMVGWSGASAGELFEQLRSTMPYEAPGILEPAEYANVMVFLFSLNGVKPGEKELPPDKDALDGILIDGPFEWSGGGR